MKKYILCLISACFTMIYAQKESSISSFQVSVGAGYQSLKYNIIGASSSGYIGEMFQLNYHYRFNRTFGLLTGLNYASYGSVSKVNGIYKTPTVDLEGENYILKSHLNNLRENSNIKFMQIPLMVECYIPVSEKVEFAAAFGVKAMIPIQSSYRVKEGTFSLSGYYPQYNIEFYDLPDHGFPSNQAIRNSASITDRVSGAIAVELGSYFRGALNKRALYVGVYLDYGLKGVTQQSIQPLVSPAARYVGVLNSNITGKVTTLGAGIKIGYQFSFNGCKIRKHGDHIAVLASKVNKLNDPLKDPLKNPISDGQSEKTEDVKFFELILLFDRSEIKLTPENELLLNDAISYMQANPNVKMDICGYTSSEGSPVFNNRISWERAQAVKNVLVKNGIDPSRLNAFGRGSENPIESNQSKEGRIKNRRVELKVIR